MCGNLFRKPKVETPVVEQVAPAPQAVSQPESAAISERAKDQKRRQRAAFGADDARIVANKTLLDKAQSGTRQTLG